MHPVFVKYQLTFLSGLSGYSVSHLRDIRAGRRSANDKFRAVMAHKLGQDEAALFLEEPINA